jgi:hypothetical protein
MFTRIAAAALLILSLGCTTTNMTGISTMMNTAAERYVRLVLSLGEHDADYVDAYYGPPEWRQEIKARKPSLDEVYTDALELRRELVALPTPQAEIEALRLEYLRKQTDALIAKAEMLRGHKFTFDEESKALYDAVAPHNSETYFQGLMAQLESELPGSGSLSDRLTDYKKDFIIPKEKLDLVFRRAVDACRERTLGHIDLPPGESFTIEYVTGKSWSGYNWYQGNYKSLIQVNTDLPIYIDRAIDLACHEGYPGHHVYNVLLEKNLVRDRGWVEASVYPLNSPQSLIAEGSANYGIEMAFPGEQRAEFERTHLFPLAGIDPARAAQYYRIDALVQKFTYAGNEAARRYLNGEINAAQAAEWLTRYGLYSPERARQRVRFMDQYRSYVINYNLGKDLVRQYVQRESGDDEAKRWEVFERLLSTPRLPSGLR